MEIIYSLINQTLFFFEKSGYLGIFFLMALESTLIPIPSELIIPPAAYLAYKGKMSVSGVIIFGTLGSLAGSLFNYFMALRVGRPFILYLIKRYGNFFLLTEKGFYKIERFWENHGHISIFIGRLLPGFRHVISIPAGLARMDLLLFSFFTTFGAGIWCAFLAFCGYFFGKNEVLLKEYLHKGSYGIIIFCIILIAFYIKFKLKK
ncbi:MAG: DedA family protein [Thermodesulfobacterium sp.]|nr:DedA family protein [Thermodesulfobacterium sp.]